MRVTAAIGAFVGLLCLASLANADTELKNDGFTSGGTAGFQGGFVTGEAGASRFFAPAAGRQLVKVQLLFGGGSTAVKTVTFKVWDDTAGTDAPGAELFSADYDLTGSDTALSEIVVGTNVVLPQQFRVGIFFQHNGAPSIARDADNTIAADKNYIFASGGLGWQKSSVLGLTGDWVIRAFITDGAGSPDAGPGGGGSGTPDAGVGAACQGNTDCPVMQFCDLTNHHCTFECRTAADCGTGTCNSLGMCVGTGNNGKGAGCCQTDRGGQAGGVLLGIGVLFFLRRRRR
jgi:hypothetical protein